MEKYGRIGLTYLANEIAAELGLIDAEQVECAVRQHWTFDETDQVLLRAIATMMGEALLSPDFIAYPANWKEALRERFAPQWLKERWPVQYKRWDAIALYPKLPIPDEESHIIFREVTD